MKNTFSFLFSIAFCVASYAQTYTLGQLQQKFKHKNYTEKVLLDFQKRMENLEEKPILHEYIPGEVIAWSLIDGPFHFQNVFLIENDTIRKVEALPKDGAFLNKLNSYVPEKSKFAYDFDLWTFPFVKEKLADNFYLIKVNVKSFNSHPEMPNPDILLYSLEYKTKDFIDFRLLRLKESHSEKWIEVGEY